jgi:hypothetical protein
MTYDEVTRRIEVLREAVETIGTAINGSNVPHVREFMLDELKRVVAALVDIAKTKA